VLSKDRTRFYGTSCWLFELGRPAEFTPVLTVFADPLQGETNVFGRPRYKGSYPSKHMEPGRSEPSPRKTVAGSRPTGAGGGVGFYINLSRFDG